MGSLESKPGQPSHPNEPRESPVDDSAPSTPILTPLDPRSPTANIARTPLELILGSKTCDENTPEIAETNGEVENVILGIDPRSPTVEFNRTPIIISTITKENPVKLQNKNFDNVLKSTIQTTPVATTRKVIPPKYLGSSPLASAPKTNKRKSLVGLLETNIDFTETDLDSVCRTKELLETDKIEGEMGTLQLDPEVDQPQIVVEEEVVGDSLEVVEAVELVEDIEQSPEEKTINVTAQVKDFDKKLTNLIYQDDSEDDNKLSLKFVKLKENNRTPLGVRNSNEEPKKPTSRLKVSDKPRKSEVSKIPVSKESRKIGIQCENTPPRKMEEKKVKSQVSQWDGDKTLII